MVGWFALNVPAALGIYWVVNNIVTTATTLYIRNSMPKIDIATGGGGATAVMESKTVDFNPTSMNERAVGFGSRESDDGMKTITPIDAEVIDVDEEDETIDRPDIPGATKGKASPDICVTRLLSIDCI
jgi:YidC/Oxa1 family membrane protein insertase